MDCKLEEQLLARKKFEIYKPIDTTNLLKEDKEKAPEFITGRHHMVLDGSCLKSLEILENSLGGLEGTLLQRLDTCTSPMGKRLVYLTLLF